MEEKGQDQFLQFFFPKENWKLIYNFYSFLPSDANQFVKWFYSLQ